jgi:hypothetical protein
MILVIWFFGTILALIITWVIIHDILTLILYWGSKAHKPWFIEWGRIKNFLIVFKRKRFK